MNNRLVHNISVEWLSTYADGGLTDADMEAISEPLNRVELSGFAKFCRGLRQLLPYSMAKFLNRKADAIGAAVRFDGMVTPSRRRSHSRRTRRYAESTGPTSDSSPILLGF